MSAPSKRAKAWHDLEAYPRKQAHTEVAKVSDALWDKQSSFRSTAVHYMRLRVGSQDLAG